MFPDQSADDFFHSPLLFGHGCPLTVHYLSVRTLAAARPPATVLAMGAHITELSVAPIASGISARIVVMAVIRMRRSLFLPAMTMASLDDNPSFSLTKYRFISPLAEDEEPKRALIPSCLSTLTDR